MLNEPGNSKITSDLLNKSAKTTGPYYMTEETLQERAKKVNAGRFATQVYAGILASVSSVSFGTVLGWSSPAIRIAIDKESSGIEALDSSFDLSWVAALGPLGCALGVPVWSYFNIKLGPKKTMLIQAPLLFLTWIAIAWVEEARDEVYKNNNLELAMRFFCGFFAISYRICGETLLQDTVHKHYLRYMVVPYRSFVNLGVLLTYVMGYSVAERFFAIVNCVIVLIHFIMLLVCPESPIYLYDKSLKKAEESLRWYRGKSNIYVEMRKIKKDADIRKLDPAAYKYMLYSKVVMKAIVIIIMVHCGQVFSCYFMYLYYNPSVVKAKVKGDKIGDFQISESDDSISRNVDALILGSNMFLSCLLSTWIHFRLVFGIKKPLLLSSALVTIILSMIGAYLFFVEAKFVFVFQRNTWIYQILVNLLILSFELGLSVAPDIMLVDYVPNEVFPRAKLIIKSSQWIIIFIVTKMFFNISEVLYGSGTFILFTMLSLCICVASRLFVVESKGKTLVQVQTEIGGNPVGTRGVYNKKLCYLLSEPGSDVANEAMLL